tara:strand:+ start:1524 stop:1772 length:249 start_codon:yes stop_codon:yes gene_type:complete
MKNTTTISTQNSLFKHLLEATEIDDIQCRYVAFKLTQNSVKTIISIKRIDKLKYTLKTDNGSYKIEATDLPLPISKVQRIWT